MADTRVKGREAAGVPKVARLYRGYNVPAPGVNTDIFTAVKVSEGAVALRITVALAVQSVVNLYVTNGTTAFTWGLNGSVAVGAGDLKTMTVPVMASTGTADLTYTLRVESDGVIQCCIVDEITGPVSIGVA